MIYSIVVTYKCDWDCSYCSTDTHSKMSPSIDDITTALEKIELNSEVSITGGEPGFAKRDVLEHVISELQHKNCHITVNTNGAFFTRYPDLCDDVDDFFYHCSEDLDTSVDMYRPDPSYVVDYMLVVNDNNVDKLGLFLNKYPDITFLIHGSDPAKVKGKPGPTLSKANAIQLWIKYKRRIHPDSALRLLESSNKLCAEEKMVSL